MISHLHIDIQAVGGGKAISVRTAALAIFGLAALLAIFYRRHLLGLAFIPFDSKDVYYHFAVFVTQSFRAGEIPLWNPYLFSGTPAFGDPIYQMFYPAILLLALPGRLTPGFYDLVELLHILVGVSRSASSRQFKMSWPAAALSAAVFMLGGPMVARVQHVAQVFAISLLPLCLVLLTHAVSHQRRAFFVYAGVVTGFCLMIGWQVSLLAFLVLVGYTLSCLFRVDRAPSANLGLMVNLALFGAIAAGIAAIQYLPALEFASQVLGIRSSSTRRVRAQFLLQRYSHLCFQSLAHLEVLTGDLRMSPRPTCSWVPCRCCWLWLR